MRTLWGIVLLALCAVAASADAAPVPVTLISHNMRGFDATLATLLWKSCPGPNYAVGSGCVNPTNAWFVANGVTASTATWTWDSSTGILASSGVFSTTLNTTSNPNSPAAVIINNYRVVDLVLNTTAGTTSATSYNCVEGGYAASFNSNACLNLPLGPNFTLDSSVVYNVGGNANCIDVTVGGDDAGPPYPVGLFTAAAGGGCDEVYGTFDLWTVVANDGGSIVVSNGIPLTNPGTQYLTFAGPNGPSTEVVSNLTQPYNFGAGLGGAFVETSSFTTGAQAYRLDSVTLDLQVNSPGTVALSLFNDSGGLPGASVANLGTQAIIAGEHDTVYPASGATVLQPNTRYWLIVEQIGGGSTSWVSTYSTAESSPSGVTIGNDMYYHNVGQTTWVPMPTATDAGQFSVRGTLAITDSDGDAIYDIADNCTLLANPTQLDADHDGYGNACDGDLNNSGLTTASDNTALRNLLNHPAAEGQAAAAADMNGSGTVTAADNTLLRNRLNTAPGPSSLACAGTIPCQ